MSPFTKTSHAEYLATPRWRQVRKQFLNEYVFIPGVGVGCERCHMPRWLVAIVYDQDLHAHHTSYANVGTDMEFADLEALCRRCHEIEEFGRSEFKEPKSATCQICKTKHWNPYRNSCGYCDRMLAEEVGGLFKYFPLCPPGYEANDDKGEPIPGCGPSFLELLAHRLPAHFREEYMRLFVAPNLGPELESIFSESTSTSVSVASMVLAQLYFAYGTDQLLDALGTLSTHYAHNCKSPLDNFPPGISTPEGRL